ncbi:MAG: histidine phosphotransferase family protein, partial [Rhodospirillales bacterium]|nr:histidine phosphotransferase family protein [Rhodospirillales bacterium]
MTDSIDLRVAGLLCSRMCHDLVSPVGAINNGIELLGDAGGSVAEESLALIGRSAEQASRRLAFFRVAFGLGRPAGRMDGGRARGIVADYLADGPVSLEWNIAPVLCEEMPDGAVRLLLNLVLMLAESLPRGGVVSVHAADLSDGLGLALRAEGEKATIGDDRRGAISDAAAIADLTPRNVQAYFTSRLATELGAGLQ